MPEETLILKRNPDAEYSESYNVLFECRYVGRIYKAVSRAPCEAPWFWTSGRAAMDRRTATSRLWKLRSRRSAPRGIADRSRAEKVRRQAFLPQQVWQSHQRALANRDLLCPIIKAAGFPAP